MDISIRDLGGCRKELAVVVPASEVDAELEKAFQGVRDQVSLPGFRQGKVPRSLIEKRFGAALKGDVANEIVGKAVEKAVADHSLELVSEPEVDPPPPPPESGQEMRFSFRVEVKPAFELPEYKGVAVTRTVRSVSDADVDAVIQDIRERNGVLKSVPEGSAFEPGDFAFVDLVARDGEATVKEMKDLPLGGEHPRVRGFEVPDLARQLAGRKPDDTFECDGVWAADVHGHGHADHDHEDGEEHEHHHETRPVKVTFTVKEIKRPELPEVDDAFAKEVGEETVLGLRVAVRKRLEAAHERAADKEVDQKLLDVLVDRASFEMAQGPVDRALAPRMERRVLERMIRGQDEQAARAAVEAERQKVREIVERDAKAWLIVEKLAKKEKIFALEDDVAKEIAKIAEEQGTTPTKVRESYEAEGMLPELRANVLERKVLDFLRAHGTITEAQEAAGGGRREKESGGEEGT